MDCSGCRRRRTGWRRKALSGGLGRKWPSCGSKWPSCDSSCSNGRSCSGSGNWPRSPPYSRSCSAAFGSPEPFRHQTVVSLQKSRAVVKESRAIVARADLEEERPYAEHMRLALHEGERLAPEAPPLERRTHVELVDERVEPAELEAEAERQHDIPCRLPTRLDEPDATERPVADELCEVAAGARLVE